MKVRFPTWPATAALGGHVHHCRDCGRDRIAYNSCRNRHCPTCQASTRARWLEREAKFLLPVGNFHAVFRLPAEVATLAAMNPTALYELLFEAAALREVAANPKRLADKKSGQVNAFFRWKNESDTSEVVEKKLFLVKASNLKTSIAIPSGATADVSLRRLQKLRVAPGTTVHGMTGCSARPKVM